MDATANVGVSLGRGGPAWAVTCGWMAGAMTNDTARRLRAITSVHTPAVQSTAAAVNLVLISGPFIAHIGTAGAVSGLAEHAQSTIRIECPLAPIDAAQHVERIARRSMAHAKTCRLVRKRHFDVQ